MAGGYDSGHEAALREALGGPDLAWLRSRVRRRLERGQGMDGAVRLANPSPGQVAAVSRLLGRRLRASRSLDVRLPELSAALARAGLASDVAEAVTVLDGVVENRAALRAATDEQWRRAFAPLAAVAGRRPELGGWVEQVRRTGLLRRLARDPARGGRLAEETVAVLDQLPHQGVRLPRLAADTLGSAHAVDDGRPVDTLVLGAVRALVGEPVLEGAEARRESWAAVGILVDDLTTQVLTLNVPGYGHGVTDRLLTAGADTGEPVVLTLGQLTRHPPDLRLLAGRSVFVCENVTVLGEAADRLGRSCAPLVCTRGQPTVAVMRLLQQLTAAKAMLRYHGDFDWPGITIANRILRRTRAHPWRYSTADYLEAVPLGSTATLEGAPVEATWDGQLRRAMEGTAVQIEEEVVLSRLLADLDATP